MHNTGIINNFTLIQTIRAIVLPEDRLLVSFERLGAVMKISSPSTHNVKDLGIYFIRLGTQPRKLLAIPIICSLEVRALALS